MNSCVPFPLMTPSEGWAELQQECPGEYPSNSSKPASPPPLNSAVFMASLNATLIASLLPVIPAGRAVRSPQCWENVKEKSTIIAFPGLWQVCPPDLQLWWFLFGDAQHLVGRFRLAGNPTQSIRMLSSHAVSTTYQFYSPWELRVQTGITSCQIGFYTSYKLMF